MTTLLELDDVEVRYGVITALKGISLEVEKGAIVALLGANGPARPRRCGRSPD